MTPFVGKGARLGALPATEDLQRAASPGAADGEGDAGGLDVGEQPAPVEGGAGPFAALVVAGAAGIAVFPEIRLGAREDPVDGGDVAPVITIRFSQKVSPPAA